MCLLELNLNRPGFYRHFGAVLNGVSQTVRKIVQDLKYLSHVDATQEWQFADLNQGIESTPNIVNNEVKYKADVVRELQPLPEV